MFVNCKWKPNAFTNYKSGPFSTVFIFNKKKSFGAELVHLLSFISGYSQRGLFFMYCTINTYIRAILWYILYIFLNYFCVQNIFCCRNEVYFAVETKYCLIFLHDSYTSWRFVNIMLSITLIKKKNIKKGIVTSSPLDTVPCNHRLSENGYNLNRCRDLLLTRNNKCQNIGYGQNLRVACRFVGLFLSKDDQHKHCFIWTKIEWTRGCFRI